MTRTDIMILNINPEFGKFDITITTVDPGIGTHSRETYPARQSMTYINIGRVVPPPSQDYVSDVTRGVEKAVGIVASLTKS